MLSTFYTLATSIVVIVVAAVAASVVVVRRVGIVVIRRVGIVVVRRVGIIVAVCATSSKEESCVLQFIDKYSAPNCLSMPQRINICL